MGRFLVERFWSKIDDMEENKTEQKATAPSAKSVNVGVVIFFVLIVIAVVGATCSIVINSLINAGKNGKSDNEYTTEISVDDYDTANIIKADNNNGNIGDHVRGKTDSKVVVVEYADLQCPSCATMMPRIDRIYLEYKDRVAFIYRNFPISYHENAEIASKAAEAAGLQGKYWEMAKYLYTNRADWISESGDKLMEKLDENFKYAAPNGDLSKFHKDMESASVARKINFDYKLGRERDGVNATPAFFVNGEKVDVNQVETFADYENLIREMIETALKKAE